MADPLKLDKTDPNRHGSLNEFIQQVSKSKSLSKPFLFYVQFNSLNSESQRDLSLLCHETIIPGYTVMSQSAKVYGLPIEMPYELAFDPVRVTFWVDQSHKVPLLFHVQRDKIINPLDYSPKYRDDYETYLMPSVDICVIETSKHEVVATYSLKNAFVKSVNAMNLTWSAQNQVQEVTVDLQYEYMETIIHEGGTSTKAGSQDGGVAGGTESTIGESYKVRLAQTPEYSTDGPDTGSFDNTPTLASGFSISDYMPEIPAIEELNIDIASGAFTDAAGIGTQWSTQENSGWDSMLPNKPSLGTGMMSSFPIKFPVDISNPVNGVSINPATIVPKESMFGEFTSTKLSGTTKPSMFGDFTSTKLSNPITGKINLAKTPLNFNTVSALSPAMGAAFNLTRSVQQTLSPINTAIKMVGSVTRQVNSTIAQFTNPLKQVQQTVMQAKNVTRNLTRVTKNLPKTLKAQGTDTLRLLGLKKTEIKRATKSPLMKPAPLAKPKPKAVASSKPTKP